MTTATRALVLNIAEMKKDIAEAWVCTEEYLGNYHDDPTQVIVKNGIVVEVFLRLPDKSSPLGWRKRPIYPNWLGKMSWGLGLRKYGFKKLTTHWYNPILGETVHTSPF